MKVKSKEILNKKQFTQFAIIGSPAIKNKGMSKSVSKSVKKIEI